MDAPPDVVRPVLQQMKAKGKGIIGMKVFGAGRLRDKADECLQHELAQDFIDCLTIGARAGPSCRILSTKYPPRACAADRKERNPE